MSSSLLTDPPQSWRRDALLISTSQALLDHAVINEAFASQDVYWTDKMDPARLKRMLELSLCFGVYEYEEEAAGSSPEGKEPAAAQPVQIGFARLVTDTMTLSYLTDVFILPSHRGRGLGRWLMRCVHETLTSWPDLCRCCLFASGEHAKAFYRETLGMIPFERRGGTDGRGGGGGGGGGAGLEFLVFPVQQDLGGLELMKKDGPAQVG